MWTQGARASTLSWGPRGVGPPLLLLHGYPQTHAMWHKVAPRLAQRYDVVAADLRGYGDSGKPESPPDHAPYAKRAMAADQVALMRSLGHETFFLAGHDRGARVAHRLAVDHADAVRAIAVLDIAPTLAMYEKTTEAFARAYWHWFFLILPAPVPEKMIGADAKFLLRAKVGRGAPA
jgi:haloacetate dehalogenase